MKKIIFLLPVILSSIVFDSFAQLGIQAGINFSKMGIKTDEGMDGITTKFAPAGLIGLHYNINLGEKFYLEPAFQINMYRYIINTSYPGYAQDNKAWAAHVQIPVHFGYKLNLSEKKSLKFFAGPYLSYGVIGANRAKINNNGVQRSERQNIMFKKEVAHAAATANTYQNPIDVGLQIGVGIDLGRITIAGIYSHAFSNRLPYSDTPSSQAYRESTSMQYRQFQAVVYFAFGK